MSKEFANISINVLHAAGRTKDAHTITQRLQSKGASVQMLQVKDSKTILSNSRKIYYFSQENSSKALAQKIADEIKSVELVSPQSANAKGSKIDFSIWVITRKNELSLVTSSKSKEMGRLEPRQYAKPHTTISRVKLCKNKCGRPVMQGDDTCYDCKSD